MSSSINPVVVPAVSSAGPGNHIQPVAFLRRRGGAEALENASTFDPQVVRRDFPALTQKIRGYPLVWLDSGATTQKPQVVIDRLTQYYREDNSNIHRAAHTLAERATNAYEAARATVRAFLNAGATRDVVFTRGTTESINLVAAAWGRAHIRQGDEIVLSGLEHHSNIVPWQLLASETGAALRVIPIDDRGDLEGVERVIGPRTKLVSVAHVSNAIGTVTPVREIIAAAHRHGARMLIDGAQAVSHMPVDVRSLDADFYVFSGHKVFGPTGIGVLYGKSEALEEMRPWQGGGNMIADVTFERTTYQSAPARFEAGTGNIADAVALGTAIDYVTGIGLAQVARHEHDLLVRAETGLRDVPGVRVIGAPRERAGALSFVVDGWLPQAVGSELDQWGIAVRAGHHCAQPALRRFGLEATVRPSFALYNTVDDVDALIEAVRGLRQPRGF